MYKRQADHRRKGGRQKRGDPAPPGRRGRKRKQQQSSERQGRHANEAGTNEPKAFTRLSESAPGGSFFFARALSIVLGKPPLLMAGRATEGIFKWKRKLASMKSCKQIGLST